MNLAIEISMYPLAEDYLKPIRGFIAQLNSYQGLEVTTFPSATLLVGDYDVAMDALKHALRWSEAEYGKAVFVTKFIPGYTAD